MRTTSDIPSNLVHSVTSGRNSVVECLLPKQKVVSSNLIARSTYLAARRDNNKMPFDGSQVQRLVVEALRKAADTYESGSPETNTGANASFIWKDILTNPRREVGFVQVFVHLTDQEAVANAIDLNLRHPPFTQEQ